MTTLDFGSPVLRSWSAALVADDMDKVHLFAVPIGNVYACQLPPADEYVGRLLHLEVDSASRGRVQLTETAGEATSKVGLYPAGGLRLWAGESVTLLGRAMGWAIIGGRCVPCCLYATAPTADIVFASTATLGSWQTSYAGGMFSGAEHAINALGQIVAPRTGFYDLELSVSFQWTVAPKTLYISANGAAIVDRVFSRVMPTAPNDVLNATMSKDFSAGTVLAPFTAQTGGVGVRIAATSYGPPVFALRERPQW